MLMTGMSVCSSDDDVCLENIHVKMVQRESSESKSHNFIIFTSDTIPVRVKSRELRNERLLTVMEGLARPFTKQARGIDLRDFPNPPLC